MNRKNEGGEGREGGMGSDKERKSGQKEASFKNWIQLKTCHFPPK